MFKIKHNQLIKARKGFICFMLGWIEDSFHVALCQEEVFPISGLVNKAAGGAGLAPHLQPRQLCFVLPHSVIPRAFSE